MITPAYVQTMARYNTWQNGQLSEAIEGMDEAALYLDRKAFFGSIMHTLNHILWGDTIWMTRFSDAFAPPAVPAAQHATFTASRSEWAVARVGLDGRISDWAAGLSDTALAGDLTWVSGMLGTEMHHPRGMCVAHMFNHQTHHRGQVHAMLTAAGQKAPVSDLCFMPEGA